MGVPARKRKWLVWVVYLSIIGHMCCIIFLFLHRPSSDHRHQVTIHSYLIYQRHLSFLSHFTSPYSLSYLLLDMVILPSHFIKILNLYKYIKINTPHTLTNKIKNNEAKQKSPRHTKCHAWLWYWTWDHLGEPHLVHSYPLCPLVVNRATCIKILIKHIHYSLENHSLNVWKG